MTAPTAVAMLAVAEVAKLEVTVRADLVYAIEGLAQLRAGSAHLVAGFDSWGGYVLARFGDLLARLKLPRDERLALVASLSAAGMPVRQQADLIGVSLGTVQGDRAKLGKVIPIGPRRTAQPVRHGDRYRRAAALLAAAPDGLTLVELAATMGVTEGSASGLLSYLTAPSRGLAVRVDDRRAGQRVHVLTDLGRACTGGSDD